MSYNAINAGETERSFTMVARTDGSPITSGTVNYYLKAKSGANDGKWWRQSDQTWQASETANAMSHDADGHWEVTIDSTAITDGIKYLEYVKETGDLHVPDGRYLIGKYDISVESDGVAHADVKEVAGSTVEKSSGNRLRVDVAEWNDIELDTTNPLPNAAADAAGGLPVSDAGGLDLDTRLNKLNVSGTLAHSDDAGTYKATGFSTHNAAAVVTAMGTGTFLTAIPWNSAWDAEVQSECTDALGAFSWSGITISAVSGAVGSVTGAVGSVTAGVTVSTNNDKSGYSISGVLTTLDALDATQDSQHSTTQAAIAGISAGSAPTLLQTATVATLDSQTSFTLSAGSADDDAYNKQIAIIVDQSTSTQKTVCNITDYIGSSKALTLNESPKFTVSVGDTVYVVAASKTTLTTDVINSLTGTVHTHQSPSWTGRGWDRDFIKGDSYTGGLASSITIDNWSGDQLVSAASEIKLSGTKTVGETTTTFEWDLSPSDVTVDGTTTTIPVAPSSTDTNVEAGEYTADVRATWTTPAETVSLIQPTFTLRVVEPVSTF